MGTADTAHGIGAAILLVIRVQNKKDVQGSLKHRMRLVLKLRHFEEHVEKITGITQVVVGVRIGQTKAMAISKASQCRHFADKAVGLIFPGLRVEDFFGSGIKS